MHLSELDLEEFRAFRRLQLTIDPAGFRAIGPNASGKSTLLEAIAMLATTRSPRTSAEREIANWKSGLEFAVPPYARFRGEFVRLDGPHSVEIGISVDEGGQGALKKKVRIDERPVRSFDAVGQFKTVLFSPQDVELVSGPPSARRRYLDMTISQASRTYLQSLSRYGKVLEQRNSLLRTMVREGTRSGGKRPLDELAFWDTELVAIGAEVMAMRIGAVQALCRHARGHFERLSRDDSLMITYRSSRTPLHDMRELHREWTAPAQDVRQIISAAFGRALLAARDEELRRGVTAIGPHRDDFSVSASSIDLGQFGSRGQQRLALIAIKLGELDLLNDAAGEPPTLLLDDALSELDAGHRALVVETLADRRAQICITATDEADLSFPALDHLPSFDVRPGIVGRRSPK